MTDLPLPLLARGKVRELYEVDAEHLLLVDSGSARFAEDATTAPRNHVDADRIVRQGMVYAEAGSVELRVADNVFTNLVAAQNLPHHAQIAGHADTDQHDWQVSADAVLP